MIIDIKTMLLEQNIHEENWDNLIILDACRYDFFEKTYSEYLNGKLEKRLSKGSNTGEWLVKTFPNKYDYTYFSANPYINSHGISLKKCHKNYDKYSWNAIDHFFKIIDVWEFGWNDEHSTIHPKEVNKAYLSNKKTKKSIIHYIQPHYPFLSYKGIFYPRYTVKVAQEGWFNFLIKNVFNKHSRTVIWKKILKTINPKYELDQLEQLYLQLGIEKLLYYYEDNLRIVMTYVAKLIENIDGVTIITADHGEAFGDAGVWGHPSERHIPVLLEVPWFKVSK